MDMFLNMDSKQFCLNEAQLVAELQTIGGQICVKQIKPYPDQIPADIDLTAGSKTVFSSLGAAMLFVMLYGKRPGPTD